MVRPGAGLNSSSTSRRWAAYSRSSKIAVVEVSDGIAHHVIAAGTLSHRHRCRLRSSEIEWVRGQIVAAGKPRIRGDVDYTGESFRDAGATPLTMRGRDVGHLAVGELPGGLIDLLELKPRRVRGSLFGPRTLVISMRCEGSKCPSAISVQFSSVSP